MAQVRAKQEIYPTNIDIFQADKEAINSWFDTRFVCDNEKFVTFFQRVLIRDYGLYRQLLRNEPDISKYDWLVQQYTESQTYEKGSTVGENHNGQTNFGENTDTISHGLTTTNTTTNDINIHTKQGWETDGADPDYLTELNYTEDYTTHNGRDTFHTENGKESIIDRTEYTPTGEETTHTNTRNDNKSLTRESPMSISYSGNNGAQISAMGNNENTGDALNWQYPSAQGETAVKEISDSSHVYNDRQDVTTHESEYRITRDEYTEKGISDRTKHFNARHDKHAYNITDTDTRNGTNTQRNTGQDVTTHGFNSGTKSEGGNIENRQHITQHINTGRSIDTATLLSQAQAYIMNSSAFQWLYNRLDVCFMGIYNDSEYDYI